jgi:hypothetical protein
MILSRDFLGRDSLEASPQRIPQGYAQETTLEALHKRQ